MSCEDCESYQDGSKGVVYYRLGMANVGILACPDHARIVIERLRQSPFPKSGQ